MWLISRSIGNGPKVSGNMTALNLNECLDVTKELMDVVLQYQKTAEKCDPSEAYRNKLPTD